MLRLLRASLQRHTTQPQVNPLMTKVCTYAVMHDFQGATELRIADSTYPNLPLLTIGAKQKGSRPGIQKPDAASIRVDVSATAYQYFCLSGKSNPP